MSAPSTSALADASDYDAADDFAQSIEECYRAIRERKANGGPGWEPKDDGCTVADLDALSAAGCKYAVIYGDAPWTFATYSAKGKGRSAERHYATMSLDAIKALPVGDLTLPVSTLLLWAVMPQLPAALEVIKAWGFTFKTIAFVWIKTTRKGRLIALDGRGLHWGMGYWTRANAELCLLATRGRPKRLDAGVHQVVVSPVREHSRKPDEVRFRIERLLAGPYLELFGRFAVPRWTVFGNEVVAEPSRRSSVAQSNWIDGLMP
jgi:N6-adenosine-specific RNA methylase IME4